MRSLQPLQQHTSSMFLRSLSALSCSISIATAASIAPTVAMHNADLRVRAPPAASAAATDPSLKETTPFIELPVVLHTPSWSLPTPFPEVYLSIGDRDITCDPDVMPRKELARDEVGQIIFYDNKFQLLPTENRRILPGTPHVYSYMMNSAMKTMEKMITEVCQVQQQSEKHSEKSRSETELDLVDMFINLSLSGKHSVFMQTDVLRRYKTGSIKFREKIMKPEKFQYLDIVLDVYSQFADHRMSQIIDMSIGGLHISTSEHEARLPPTTPLQPSNAPGPGRKRIGFAIFSGDSRAILDRVGKITHPEPTAKIYEQRRYLEEFSLNLKAQSDVKLDGIVVENLELALGIYKD
ncbi:hypothetical protein F5880DRAFT_330838 [Lentinula raphanica]|nr:hypothetical protein F5880DRAFT_330838 [Lentinula raphanica]